MSEEYNIELLRDSLITLHVLAILAIKNTKEEMNMDRFVKSLPCSRQRAYRILQDLRELKLVKKEIFGYPRRVRITLTKEGEKIADIAARYVDELKEIYGIDFTRIDS